MRRIILGLVGVALLGVILITVLALLLETNPPTVKEPPWDSPQTRALAVRACFDCHSDQTHWVWWTKLPVGSWLAVFDTLRGRRALNFSEWGVVQPGGEGGEGGRGGRGVARVIQNGSMPPSTYLLLHPEAVLSDAEKQQLITGLQNTLK